MARKTSPTISQDDLYPPSGEFAQSDVNDMRMLDLDEEEESPFLRGQKRVPARRSPLPVKAATRLKWAVLAVILLTLATVASGAIYHYSEHSWRFRVQSSDDIEVSGFHNVTHAQIMEVMGGDIGRNIFFVPLAQRRSQLEQIPWVESASVMRFIPNRLKVDIRERTPVAFARVGSRISLTDAGGALMDLPAGGKGKYSFPVIVGMNTGEPHSTRAARMRIYNDLVRALDSGGARYSQELSEVDLSDPDDVKVLTSDPQGAVLVHLGSSDFLERYRIYITHVQEWRQQFAKLESVDLRYDRQIIVNPDLRAAPRPAPLSAGAARVAAAAGVKPAALVAHNSAAAKPASAPAKPLAAKPVPPATAVSKPAPSLASSSRPTTSKPKIGPPPPPVPGAASKSGPAPAAKVHAGRVRSQKHAVARARVRTPLRASKHAPRKVAQKSKAAVPASSRESGPAPRLKKPSPAISKVPVNP